MSKEVKFAANLLCAWTVHTNTFMISGNIGKCLVVVVQGTLVIIIMMINYYFEIVREVEYQRGQNYFSRGRMAFLWITLFLFLSFTLYDFGDFDANSRDSFSKVFSLHGCSHCFVLPGFLHDFFIDLYQNCMSLMNVLSHIHSKHHTGEIPNIIARNIKTCKSMPICASRLLSLGIDNTVQLVQLKFFSHSLRLEGHEY